MTDNTNTEWHVHTTGTHGLTDDHPHATTAAAEQEIVGLDAVLDMPTRVQARAAIAKLARDHAARVAEPLVAALERKAIAYHAHMIHMQPFANCTVPTCEQDRAVLAATGGKTE